MKLTRRVLHNTAKSVEFYRKIGKRLFSNELNNITLANELIEFMQQEGGIGLAAPQVGISARLFVMRVNDITRICFNPEITRLSESLSDYDEGCLSFPGEHCIIKRPENITVRYQDASGNWTDAELSGLEARCFQHELDHLNGITMWDRYKEQHAEQS